MVAGEEPWRKGYIPHGGPGPSPRQAGRGGFCRRRLEVARIRLGRGIRSVGTQAHLQSGAQKAWRQGVSMRLLAEGRGSCAVRPSRRRAASLPWNVPRTIRLPIGRFKLANGMYEINEQGKVQKKKPDATIYVGGDDCSDDYIGTKDYPFETLEQALTAMTSSAAYTIVLKGDLSAGQTLSGEPSATKITIDGEYNSVSHAIVGNSEGDEPALTISTSISVEIKNLTIRGNDISSDLNFNTEGAGLYVGNYANVTLGENTVITGNTAKWGGGVYNLGLLIITSNANISGNTATQNGGGICVMSEGEIDMQGGTISNNTANNFGGGIYSYGSTVAMTSGTISGNIAQSGGAIFTGSASTFQMGGTASIPAGATVGGNFVTGSGKNDVWLNYDSESSPSQQKLEILNSLTATATVATITPATYDPNVQLLDGDAGTIAANCGKFAVTPQTKGDDGNELSVPIEWTIDDHGYLKKVSGGSNNGGGTSWTGTDNGHEWVDLGLPSGTKWATMNVGATETNLCGSYYAWGETNPVTGSYTFSSNPEVLPYGNDVAAANFGGNWAMPTDEEYMELFTNCYWEWTANYNETGIAGRVVYKAKDAADKGQTTKQSSEEYKITDVHIFLPAAGYKVNGAVSEQNINGGYWSSSIAPDNSKAYSVGFRDIYVYVTTGNSTLNITASTTDRYVGFSVRPVIPSFVKVKEEETNLYVSRTLITQAEYEKYMVYHADAVASSTYKPTETSAEDKVVTPAYYISLVDAIVYCNLRSKAEGLDPVYSMNIAYEKPDNADWKWKRTNDVSEWTIDEDLGVVAVGEGDNIKYCFAWERTKGNEYYENWDLDRGYLQINDNASGYRLPEQDEIKAIGTWNASNGNVIKSHSGMYEWTNDLDNNGRADVFSGDITAININDDFYNWYCNYSHETWDGTNYTSNLGFRVVRNIPTTNP